MKKTLLSVLAGLTVVGSAFALPTPEDRKVLCEKHPDKYVWVEKTKACVPINPCKSDDSAIRTAYCNTSFARIQLARYTSGQKLAEAYLKNVLHLEGTYIKEDGRPYNTFGQDYLRYKTSDNGYIVFEFDDLSDITDFDVREGALRGTCIAFGFTSSDFRATDDSRVRCYFDFMEDENLCKNMGDLATEVFNSSNKDIVVEGVSNSSGCDLHIVD